MGRLCERPGCSEVGEIAYGFDPAMLLVWLRQLDGRDDRHQAGVLCVRHADAMVLPRDWSLDDARDVVPRLFPARRHLAPTDAGSGPRRPPPVRRRSGGRQLHLELLAPVDEGADEAADVAIAAGAAVPTDGAAGVAAPAPDDVVSAAPGAHEEATVTALTGVASTRDPDDTVALPWRPDFDAADDLDGALAADTPLLARAFRAGARRKP